MQITRDTTLPLFAAALLAFPAPARAQAGPTPTPAPIQTSPPSQQTAMPARAQENVVRQADDGFGATIGRESIGIYTAGNVRGFSALAAGNARINGLFFDQIAAPNPRIRRSTAIRVGLSALTFPFPAPTGVVDYTLTRPGEAALSVTVSADSYENASLELDASLPVIGDRLALAGGAAVFRNDFVNGSTSRQTAFGISALARPSAAIDIQPFWARTDTYDNKIGASYAPAGDFLPPDVPRRRFAGQDWSRFDGAAQLYGMLGRARLGDGWTIDGGLFRSEFLTKRDTFVLLDRITPGGDGRYLVFTDPPGSTASSSGELRLARVFTEGELTHRLIASLRGRDRRQLFAGSDARDFGTVAIGERRVFAEPDFIFTEQSRDRIRQVAGGLAYAMRWDRRGEISLGLSLSDYGKRLQRPGDIKATTSATPLLAYGSIALHLIGDLVVYAGYADGLEESGIAPQNATNRNEALPAILTSQRDAGIRWSINERLRLVAGLFDVRKPYFNRDATGLFAQLGDVRSRGIEMSLSGALTSWLTTVVGAVLLDPQVNGEGVALGRVGPRPVGLPRRKLDLSLDWRTPVDAISLDLRVAHQSRRPATTLNRVYLPDRTLIDMGGRYRFDLAGHEAMLRVSIRNLFDVRDFDVFGSGTYDIINGRTLSAYLAVDF